MPRDQRDPLDVLKSELQFLEKGGYAWSAREPWRAQLFFEDSSSCMNYGRKSDPQPCAECVLLQFVPLESRSEKVPCRHIPITHDGETLLDLYHGSTQLELEDTMADWLRRKIAQLEQDRKRENSERGAGPANSPAPPSGTQTRCEMEAIDDSQSAP